MIVSSEFFTSIRNELENSFKIGFTPYNQFAPIELFSKVRGLYTYITVCSCGHMCVEDRFKCCICSKEELCLVCQQK